jgi:hypothetical protein
VQDHGYAPILELAGYDEANKRGKYWVGRTGIRQLNQARSRWRFQLSARYVF